MTRAMKFAMMLSFMALSAISLSSHSPALGASSETFLRVF